MRRTIRDTLLSVRDLLITAGPFILLTLGAARGAPTYLLKPTPPKRVVLATGPEQSDYAEFGKRYAEELKRYGIEVVLRATDGSRENRACCATKRRTWIFGFVHGGSSEALTPGGRGEGRRAAGVAGQPVLRAGLAVLPAGCGERNCRDRKPASLAQFAQWRVNTGARGSGATGIMSKLMNANGIDARDR